MSDWVKGPHEATRWQPAVLPCVTWSTFIETIAHFASYICFVSASCQTIAIFNQSVRRNLLRITAILPRRFRRTYTPLEWATGLPTVNGTIDEIVAC